MATAVNFIDNQLFCQYLLPKNYKAKLQLEKRCAKVKFGKVWLFLENSSGLTSIKPRSARSQGLNKSEYLVKLWLTLRLGYACIVKQLQPYFEYISLKPLNKWQKSTNINVSIKKSWWWNCHLEPQNLGDDLGNREIGRGFRVQFFLHNSHSVKLKIIEY